MTVIVVVRALSSGTLTATRSSILSVRWRTSAFHGMLICATLMILRSHPLHKLPQQAPVSATLKLSLTPGTTITGVSFAYQYVTGYHGAVGANFTLDVAGTAAYSSPTVNNYPYSKSGGIGAYSPAVNVASKGLSIAVPSSGGGTRV